MCFKANPQSKLKNKHSKNIQSLEAERKTFYRAFKKDDKSIKHLLYCFINKTAPQNCKTDMGDETYFAQLACYDSVKQCPTTKACH